MDTGRDDATAGESGPEPPGPFVEMASPTGTGARTPRFGTAREGVLLSWQRVPEADPTSDTEPQASVEVARWDGEWTSPRRIVQRDDLFVNWADFPSVVELDDGRLAAHWLQYNGPGTYAYQVRLSFSSDGGDTWSDPVLPHEDSTETEHGFVTLLPDGDGIEVFWLDGRAYAAGNSEMSFRHVRVGAPSDARERPTVATNETVLDERTCDCCQTAVVRAGSATVALYRGRSADEIRDIEVVSRVADRWSRPVSVHDDGWRIDACPVNGPSAAAHGDTVVAVWFTAAGDDPRVLVARSEDAGASVAAPRRGDEGGPIGRVAALALSDGRIALAWIENGNAGGGGARVRVRLLGRSGRLGPATSVADVSTARASGFPVVAEHDGHLLVAWTDAESNRVRIFRGALN